MTTSTLPYCHSSSLFRLFGGAGLLAGLLCALPAQAQVADYPSKPIHLIQGVSAASSSGVLGRLVASWLSKELGQSIVVENMAGAGGTLGMAAAAKAKPDGYTLVMFTQAQAISETLFDKLNYRLMDDFQPITQITSSYYVLAIHPGVQANSVKELIALAKAKPGVLNFANSGNGTGTHLAAALFTYKTGVDIVHIPYKGTAAGLGPFMAGNVHLYFLGVPSLQPLLKSGKARALAVTSGKRSADFPDLPTLAETIPGYEMTLWQGLAAPAGTPRPIIDKVRAATIKVVNTAEAKAQLAKQSVEVETSTPEAFRAYIKSQISILAEAIRASGAKVE